MRKRGFTLVEIAIVMLVMAILIGIAVPQFLRSRSYSQMKTCMSSLKKIEEAKEMWAVAMHQPAGAECAMRDIVPDFVTRVPKCPSDGVYTVGTVDDHPTCTIAGTFPHKL